MQESCNLLQLWLQVFAGLLCVSRAVGAVIAGARIMLLTYRFSPLVSGVLPSQLILHGIAMKHAVTSTGDWTEES